MFILKFLRNKILMIKMRNFKKNNKKILNNVNLCPIIFSFFSIFIILFLFFSNYKIYQKKSNIDAQLTQKEMEINDLKEKLKDIESLNKDNLNDDYQAEKIAREQLLLKKEGEEVVFVTVPNQEKELDENQEEQGNFFWWNPFTWKFK
jgi:cell division protein FtsB